MPDLAPTKDLARFTFEGGRVYCHCGAEKAAPKGKKLKQEAKVAFVRDHEKTCKGPAQTADASDIEEDDDDADLE
jgi:hypothetical protein